MSAGVGAAFLLNVCLTTQAAAITAESLNAYQQGVAAERAGDLKAAESAFRKAMETDPDDVLNYIKLASTLAQMGRLNESISLYTRASEMDSQDHAVLHAGEPL